MEKTLLDLRALEEIEDEPIWGDREDAMHMAIVYLQSALHDETKPIDANRLRAAVALLNFYNARA